MTLEQIHPNPKNPRFLRQEKSEWLEESLAEFGDLSGYVFNKNGMIISAHQRWEKIKPKVKEIVVRETFKKPLPDGTIERGHFELTDGTKHDYSVRDWTPEKADRATIRANAQNAGEWDADILANQWEFEPDELQEMGVPEWVFGGSGETDDLKEPEIDPERVNAEYQNYLNQNIRQIVLYYEGELYERVVNLLQALCKKHDIEENSTLILKLIEAENDRIEKI